MQKLALAAPNFSEGRRSTVIDAIVNEVSDVPGVKLIGYYPDADLNRTVMELIGRPEPLKECLLRMAGKTYELIDMETHKGDHPRIGALDVLPLFPSLGMELAECVQLAEDIGHEIFNRFGVPIYFRGENARCEQRKNLAFIRDGQYEGLKKVAHLPERAPDIGPAALHPSAGATILSAQQEGLIGVNVLLGTTDVGLAKRIARSVRGPSGGFSTIRSVGFPVSDRGCVAVSMDMLDPIETPIHRALLVIEAEAQRHGVSIVGTQIVGTLPLAALVVCAEHYLRLEDFGMEQIIEMNVLDVLRQD